MTDILFPQYLEMRFSKAVRICGTLTFICQMVSPKLATSDFFLS